MFWWPSTSSHLLLLESSAFSDSRIFTRRRLAPLALTVISSTPSSASTNQPASDIHEVTEAAPGLVFQKAPEAPKATSSLSKRPTNECFASLVTVEVGAEKKRFTIHKNLLCFYSDYFRGAFNGNFKEANEKKISLPDEDLGLFWIFHGFIYTNRLCDTDDKAGSDIQSRVLIKLWFFGDKYLAPAFQNMAMDCLIKRINENGLKTNVVIKNIYNNTMSGSPLRKVVVDWQTYVINTTKEKLAEWPMEALVNVPRLSYLPFLLPRLHAFFAPNLINPSIPPHSAWLSFQNVALKYHYPIGLLYDLFSGSQPSDSEDDGTEEAENLPWKLELRYSEFPREQLMELDAEGKVADVIRNGKGNVYLGLSQVDCDTQWQAVQSRTSLRNVPMKIYLPTAPIPNPGDGEVQASIRTVQDLVPLFSASRQANTLGMALNTILKTVFPSRRNPVLASPVLHGAVVPMSAPVEELMRAAAFADGFLHVVVVML
ncbi:putative autophagy protein Apg5 [Aureobasidium subglaciale]|nr:putative autophagy protein Apg5 [Aureobasidium subglaciale]